MFDEVEWIWSSATDQSVRNNTKNLGIQMASSGWWTEYNSVFLEKREYHDLKWKQSACCLCLITAPCRRNTREIYYAHQLAPIKSQLREQSKPSALSAYLTLVFHINSSDVEDKKRTRLKFYMAVWNFFNSLIR